MSRSHASRSAFHSARACINSALSAAVSTREAMACASASVSACDSVCRSAANRRVSSSRAARNCTSWSPRRRASVDAAAKSDCAAPRSPSSREIIASFSVLRSRFRRQFSAHSPDRGAGRCEWRCQIPTSEQRHCAGIRVGFLPVEHPNRMQHQEAQIPRITPLLEVLVCRLDAGESCNKRLEVPKNFEPAETINRVELAFCVRLEPLNRSLGRKGRVREINFPIADLGFCSDGSSVPKCVEHIVKTERVCQIEQSVMDPQDAVRLDDRHRVREAPRQAEFIAPGAKALLGYRAPQR